MLDRELLTTFIERWHNETSSFHFLFCEMTITLDDTSYLFHILLADSFFIASLTSQYLTCVNAIYDLGFIEEKMIKMCRVNKGTHFCLSWLRDMYDNLVH